MGLAAALLLAAPVAADPVTQWHAEIAAASARFGIPRAWISDVIRAESGGRTQLNGRPITSHAGAMGLMQLMPATWHEMRAAHDLGPDPHAPRDNILAGTAYLRAMYDRFGHPGLFGAYHAGPGRYAAHLVSGRALPAETRAYLATLSGAARAQVRTTPPPAAPGLFALRREHETSPAKAEWADTHEDAPDRLFAIRTRH